MDFVENLSEILRGKSRIIPAPARKKPDRGTAGARLPQAGPLPDGPLQGNVGKIFGDKIHLVHLPGAAAEGIQRTGIGGKGEGELIGVEGLPLAAIGLVLLLAAILAVPQKGVSGGGKLGPDLVGPAGDQLALHQGQPPVYVKRPIQRDRSFSAGHRFFVDRDLLFSLIL